MKKIDSSEIILSIAIPTHNGAETIVETLDSIVCQIGKGIEIIISDNASTDNTKNIIANYQIQYPAIRYHRNEFNVGGEKNINLAIERATAKFVWILGDDDKIQKGGIAKILEVLSENINNDIAFIFVNLSIWSRDFKECYNKKYLSLDEDLIIKDPNIFLELLGAYAAYTPCLVMNKNVWIENKNTLFDGTGWMTLSKLYYVLPGRKVYIISTPYAIFRDGSRRCHEGGKWYVQMLNLIAFFNTLPEKGYSYNIVKKEIKKYTKILPNTIIDAKVSGLKVGLNIIKDSAFVFNNRLYFILIILPLLLTPNIILKILHKIKSIIKIR
jgi:glycosyltransferase involved in cell wall biosynthesis